MQTRSKGYLVVIEREPGSNYSAYVPDLPGCVATGATREALLDNVRDAITMHIEGMREDQEPVPEPRTDADFVPIP